MCVRSCVCSVHRAPGKLNYPLPLLLQTTVSTAVVAISFQNFVQDFRSVTVCCIHACIATSLVLSCRRANQPTTFALCRSRSTSSRYVFRVLVLNSHPGVRRYGRIRSILGRSHKDWKETHTLIKFMVDCFGEIHRHLANWQKARCSLSLSISRLVNWMTQPSIQPMKMP